MDRSTGPRQRRRNALRHADTTITETTTTTTTTSNDSRRGKHHMYDTHRPPHHRGEHSRGGHDHDGRGGHGRGRDHDGRGGHGRHRARRGALVAAVLTLLDERPMHGYELITELEDRSEGRWRPSPGAMYPALKKMVARELITADEVDGKRQFSLSDLGRERLAELQAERPDDAAAPWDQTNTGGRGELRGELAELMGQARQLSRFGTAAQIEQARGVFEQAKRQLYAILAQADAADSPAAPADATPADTDGDAG